MSVNDSWLEWGPKRPPRPQKSPGEAGTWMVETGKAVDAFGRRARRARLLAREPEVADEARLRGIGEIVDLRHAMGPPAAGMAVGDEVGDAAVTLPPVLVGHVEARDHRGQQGGLGGVADVPHLVGEIAERAKQIGLAARPPWQRGAVAAAHHLRPSRLRLAGGARDMTQVARATGIGHIHDGGAAPLHLRGEGIRFQPAVMADVGDPAVALVMDDGL